MLMATTGRSPPRPASGEAVMKARFVQWFDGRKGDAAAVWTNAFCV